MQIILIQDVNNLGGANEVVTVKNGYARNFLIPRKMAVEASPSNIKQLEERLKQDYTTMAGLFSVVTGITIEHYIIQHKIEKVKELLLYENLNLTEIAHRMNYSSVSHLSYQFKKVTGLTPSFFKKIKSERIQLKKEEVGNSILTKDIL